MVEEWNSYNIFYLREDFEINAKFLLYHRVSSYHVYLGVVWGATYKVWMS